MKLCKFKRNLNWHYNKEQRTRGIILITMNCSSYKNYYRYHLHSCNQIHQRVSNFFNHSHSWLKRESTKMNREKIGTNLIPPEFWSATTHTPAVEVSRVRVTSCGRAKPQGSSPHRLSRGATGTCPQWVVSKVCSSLLILISPRRQC